MSGSLDTWCKSHHLVSSFYTMEPSSSNDSSSVYAQDIWESKFAKDPWDRETWNRYRREILQRGHAHPDVLNMIAGYLGRPVRTEPLIDSLLKGTEISVSSSDESCDESCDESISSSDENTDTKVPGVNRKPSMKRRKTSSNGSENMDTNVAGGNRQPPTKRKKE